MLHAATWKYRAKTSLACEQAIDSPLVRETELSTRGCCRKKKAKTILACEQPLELSMFCTCKEDFPHRNALQPHMSRDPKGSAKTSSVYSQGLPPYKDYPRTRTISIQRLSPFKEAVAGLQRLCPYKQWQEKYPKRMASCLTSRQRIYVRLAVCNSRCTKARAASLLHMWRNGRSLEY